MSLIENSKIRDKRILKNEYKQLPICFNLEIK